MSKPVVERDYKVIPITNVNQIGAETFIVYTEGSNSYLPSLEEMIHRCRADRVFVIEHRYKNKLSKTYYIPMEEDEDNKPDTRKN